MPQQSKWKAIVRRRRPAGPLEQAFGQPRIRRLGTAMDVLLGRTPGCSCPVCVHHRGSGRVAGEPAERVQPTSFGALG